MDIVDMDEMRPAGDEEPARHSLSVRSGVHENPDVR
jgi:hypothetical protein